MQGRQIAIAAAAGAGILIVGLVGGFVLFGGKGSSDPAARIADWQSRLSEEQDAKDADAKADLEKLRVLRVDDFEVKDGEIHREATYTITNTMDVPISSILLWLTVEREGRSVADAEGMLGGGIPGGIEPGESHTMTVPLIFGGLGNVEITPESRFKVEVVGAQGADDKEIANALSLFK